MCSGDRGLYKNHLKNNQPKSANFVWVVFYFIQQILKNCNKWRKHFMVQLVWATRTRRKTVHRNRWRKKWTTFIKVACVFAEYVKPEPAQHKNIHQASGSWETRNSLPLCICEWIHHYFPTLVTGLLNELRVGRPGQDGEAGEAERRDWLSSAEALPNPPEVPVQTNTQSKEPKIGVELVDKSETMDIKDYSTENQTLTPMVLKGGEKVCFLLLHRSLQLFSLDIQLQLWPSFI